MAEKAQFLIDSVSDSILWNRGLGTTKYSSRARRRPSDLGSTCGERIPRGAFPVRRASFDFPRNRMLRLTIHVFAL